MAEEPEKPENQEEEAPAKETEETPVAAKASGGSPWLPVLVVIIVLPILSLVVTEFVIIPRVKKAVDQIAQVQAESGHPASGGSLPTSHEPAKVEKASGGHGGGHGESTGGAAKAMEFESIVANLSGSMKTRFLKVSFTLESNMPDGADIVKNNRTKLIDATLGVLGSLTITDLEDPGMKNIVRNDLIDSYNHILGQHVIDALFFSEFVIQ